MDKRIALCLLILVAVAGAGFAIVYHENEKTPVSTTSQNVTQNPGVQYEAAISINIPVGNVYINFRNGTPSRIFLINSSATSGTFAADHIDPWDWRSGSNGSKDAYRGDRFASINGTVRNDYDQLLYFALEAHVYDRNGNQIGTLLRTSGRPEFLGAWMGLSAGDSGSFHLLLKLDRQYTAADIGRYEIFLAWEPSATPIP
jgi:hypothetical protein